MSDSKIYKRLIKEFPLIAAANFCLELKGIKGDGKASKRVNCSIRYIFKPLMTYSFRYFQDVLERVVGFADPTSCLSSNRY